MVKKKKEVLLKLDLGCGENCQIDVDGKKFTGVDKYKLKGVDIVHDLTKYPYPFKDNAATEIFCSHFVEHLDGFERMKFFNELYRILINGGKARIITPYYKSVRAYQDPTHKFPPVCENFYYYLSKKWREENKLSHYLPLTCDFEHIGTYSIQDTNVNAKADDVKMFWFDKYWNTIADLVVDITKI